MLNKLGCINESNMKNKLLLSINDAFVCIPAATKQPHNFQRRINDSLGFLCCLSLQPVTSFRREIHNRIWHLMSVFFSLTAMTSPWSSCTPPSPSPTPSWPPAYPARAWSCHTALPATSAAGDDSLVSALGLLETGKSRAG